MWQLYANSHSEKDLCGSGGVNDDICYLINSDNCSFIGVVVSITFIFTYTLIVATCMTLAFVCSPTVTSRGSSFALYATKADAHSVCERGVCLFLQHM